MKYIYRILSEQKQNSHRIELQILRFNDKFERVLRMQFQFFNALQSRGRCGAKKGRTGWICSMSEALALALDRGWRDLKPEI